MEKRKIMAIINANNINKDIKWKAHSTKNNGIVVLTNDYAKEVEFVIQKIATEEEEWVRTRDTFLGTTVTLLLKGNNSWSDFAEWDEGIERAVTSAVRSFYNYY